MGLLNWITKMAVGDTEVSENSIYIWTSNLSTVELGIILNTIENLRGYLSRNTNDTDACPVRYLHRVLLSSVSYTSPNDYFNPVATLEAFTDIRLIKDCFSSNEIEHISNSIYILSRRHGDKNIRKQWRSVSDICGLEVIGTNLKLDKQLFYKLTISELRDLTNAINAINAYEMCYPKTKLYKCASMILHEIAKTISNVNYGINTDELKECYRLTNGSNIGNKIHYLVGLLSRKLPNAHIRSQYKILEIKGVQ